MGKRFFLELYYSFTRIVSITNHNNIQVSIQNLIIVCIIFESKLTVIFTEGSLTGAVVYDFIT